MLSNISPTVSVSRIDLIDDYQRIKSQLEGFYQDDGSDDDE